MTFYDNPVVNPALREQSKREIDAVNVWVDKLKGTIIGVQIVRSGQSRPYADSVTEAVIFCHQPNSLTTNSPLVRLISKEQALAIARIFVGDWKDDDPTGWGTRLELIHPEPNPCGLNEHGGEFAVKNDLHACWRVRLRTPSTD